MVQSYGVLEKVRVLATHNNHEGLERQGSHN